MALASYFKKAALAARLSLRNRVELGRATYRIRGLLLNPLVLEHDTEPHEPWLDAVYQTILGCREGAFLDVGANTGQTMLKLLAFDKSRQYVGFEPQLRCCFFIQSFIQDNALENHTVCPFGLSNRTQLVKLHTRGNYDTMASVVERFRPESFYTSYQYAWLRKGDELLEELNISSLAAIKIDVEGGELEVIEGLCNTIREKRPFIVFEVLNHYLVATDQVLDERTIRFRESRIVQLESILRGQDYDIYNILPGNVLQKLRKIEPRRRSADLSITNYLAVPKRDPDSFLQAFPGPKRVD